MTPLLLLALAGAARAAEVSQRGDYRVVTIDLQREQLLLLGQADNIHTLAAAHAHLTARGLVPLALTNAGIFESPQDPTGLQVEQGQETSPLNLADGSGNFYLKPGGIFVVSAADEAQVLPSASWHLQSTPVLATQSGPLLLSQGSIHPMFRADSSNLRVRSGVCASAPGTVHLFLSVREVRLFDMATFARDTLGCRDALYLDGVISRLWAEGDGTPDKQQSFAGVLAVVPRPQLDPED